MSIFDEQAWDERYGARPAIWSGLANPQLVAEASDLPAGTALDVGSGEGADALWLVARHWQVTAVDFSNIALERSAAQADIVGADVAERVRWVHADLTTWTPSEAQFDLVSAQFMHLPAPPRRAMFAQLATAVAPAEPCSSSAITPPTCRPPCPARRYPTCSTAPRRWPTPSTLTSEVVVAEARPRPASDPEGRAITIHDTVVRARKRP